MKVNAHKIDKSYVNMCISNKHLSQYLGQDTFNVSENFNAYSYIGGTVVFPGS